MRKRWMVWAAMVVLLAGGSVRAAGEPLLVVVESQPGAGIDAAEVRQRIAAELVRPVVSPRDLAAPDAADVLIVALGADEIRVSLREGSATRVARMIPDAPERAARLRAIGWMAGNLARDQVSAILARAPANRDPPARVLADARPAPVNGRAATEPPPLPSVAPAPAAGGEALVVHASAASAATPIDSGWTVTATGGLATTTFFCLRARCGGAQGVSASFDGHYQLEIQHQPGTDGTIIGGALDTGATDQLLGVAAFIGTRRQGRGWFLEATLGVGVQAVVASVSDVKVISSSATGVSAEQTVSTQVRPALYGRAVGSIGVPIGRSLDILARVGVHISPPYLESEFFSTTLGVRLRLP